MPTWNLLTARQSLQAADVTLPAELTASVRVGATRLAMMGDQSQRKSREGGTGTRLLLSGGNGKCGAGQLPFLPGLRTAVRRMVPENGITDPGQLVGQGTSCLVVVRSRLNLGGPDA